MADGPIIDLQLAPRQDGDRRRYDFGGRRWAGDGLLPPDWSRAVVPGLLASLGVAAGLGLALGVGNLVPRAAGPSAGFAAIALAGVCAVSAFTRANRRETIAVVVYEKGLAYTVGDRTRAVRWSDVTAVAEQRFTRVGPLGQPAGRGHSLVLTCADGTVHDLEIGGIEEAHVLAGYVHQGTLDYLVPRAEADLAAARPVPFGPLSATPPGLVCGSDFLVWADLGRIDLVEGRLIVGRRDGGATWFDGPARGIPNLHLLLNLVEARFASRGAAGRAGNPRSRCSMLDRYKPSAASPRKRP